MKTRYFRRKQNSDAVEWIEMSGAEYLDFVRDPENKDRFFLNMKNVVLECSKEEYLQTPPLTLRAYSEKTGIPVMTLHYRKEKLLQLLKQQI